MNLPGNKEGVYLFKIKGQFCYYPLHLLNSKHSVHDKTYRMNTYTCNMLLIYTSIFKLLFVFSTIRLFFFRKKGGGYFVVNTSKSFLVPLTLQRISDNVHLLTMLLTAFELHLIQQSEKHLQIAQLYIHNS